MMKLNKLILSGVLSTLLFSCNDLDMPPRNIMQENDVFKSEAGITAYMATLYSEIPMEDHRYNMWGFNNFINFPTTYNVSGEALIVRGGDFLYSNPDGSWFQAWQYGQIRNINFFLESLEKNKENFTEDKIKAWAGEAHFMRAFQYFAMVKRYGGIPIIDKVQNFPEQSIEELKVPRNSEQDVYDFIASELDMAISMLPEKALAKGRVNRNAAYALKSRAMLYAGSIAQYGEMQLDGLLGIPSSDAKKYYQASYDASKALEGKYSLYNKYADKYENFCKLFLDEDNPEVILGRYYKFPEYCHNLEMMNIPRQLHGAEGYSSHCNPTLEFCKMFDDVDGNQDWIKIGTENDPIRYEKRTDLFAKAQPRLRATVIFPGDEYKGEEIDVRKGIYESFPGELHTSGDFTAMYKDKTIIGQSGMEDMQTTSTGLYIRKYGDPSIDISNIVGWRGTVQWIEMRYGEILLNRAEAAFALGNVDDALNCINQIRERGGAKLLTKGQMTAKKIQLERRMELAFESHTYWDLRRWRIASTEIDAKQYYALCPYYVYDEGKYIFKEEKVGPMYTFYTKVNYVMIPKDQIVKNDLLVQNPGY